MLFSERSISNPLKVNRLQRLASLVSAAPVSVADWQYGQFPAPRNLFLLLF
ncbi:hypothetical protein SAMN02745166_05137 [Prosthecobacter debontii]|uniref:Uncharacterized protein n=1 Tax=Prosthecobacter debontii TaxID=48467 RepID=A0A1T4YHN3_9BACT|nr:hypothetical protein SAMN02745166_03360 [Prosthecobacter debontii]SKB04973.1 hypothetical protein SAMN02745166_04178 [Prosthecobacter debontii]SKB09177.1 hypothetical protein SAMN02745166_05112 [Prosthecobacter debontii]SKB09390.1 hypothetical protein SAMN02745166_05137 [Prosthecobacter debontii]